jgi:pyridoxal phosphate enzyme (YggS family)
MVGHLQTNKVKYIIPFISLIHSVDSIKLLGVINNESLKINKIRDCLLQVHIAMEETKFGFSETELVSMLKSQEFAQLRNVRIAGLMGMATFTDDKFLVREEFRNLAMIFQRVKRDFYPDQDYFREISMGMSGDYEIAIEEGSTMVRIGTLIFGERELH